MKIKMTLCQYLSLGGSIDKLNMDYVYVSYKKKTIDIAFFGQNRYGEDVYIFTLEDGSVHRIPSHIVYVLADVVLNKKHKK